jgi:metal-responsive CopG/Arc/MetJ family transcriptional regulator
MRRALVSLPDGVWNVIDKELKGQIGDGDSEVIRNVVIAYLTEKGYLLKPKTTKAAASVSTDQIASELDIHDNMISSLAEMLEEKGQLSYDEWERRVQKKLHKSAKKQ